MSQELDDFKSTVNQKYKYNLGHFTFGLAIAGVALLVILIILLMNLSS